MPEEERASDSAQEKREELLTLFTQVCTVLYKNVSHVRWSALCGSRISCLFLLELL